MPVSYIFLPPARDNVFSERWKQEVFEQATLVFQKIRHSWETSAPLIEDTIVSLTRLDATGAPCVISSLSVLLQREEVWSGAMSWLEGENSYILNSQEAKILKEKKYTASQSKKKRGLREDLLREKVEGPQPHGFVLALSTK